MKLKRSLIAVAVFCSLLSPAYAQPLELDAIWTWQLPNNGVFELGPIDDLKIVHTNTPEGPVNIVTSWGELLFPESGFDSIGSFSEGLVWVSKDDQIAFVDSTGAFVIPFMNAYSVRDFHEGLSIIRIDENLAIGVDQSGTVVFEWPYMGNVRDFSDGLAPAFDVQAGKWGYIDRNGSWAIEPKYDLVFEFIHGLAEVCIRSEEQLPDGVTNRYYSGVINQKGEEVLPCIYSDIEDIDPNGWIVTVRYSPSYEHRLFRTDGSEPFSQAFLDVSILQNGYILVKKEENGVLQTGVLTGSGEWSIPWQPWNIRRWEQETYIIEDTQTELLGTMNSMGEVIIKPCFKEIFCAFSNEMFFVEDVDGTKEIVDEKGVEIPALTECLHLYSSHGDCAYFPQQDWFAWMKYNETVFTDGEGTVLMDRVPFGAGYAFSDGNLPIYQYNTSGDEIRFGCLLDPYLKDYTSQWAQNDIAQATAADLVTESNSHYFTFYSTRRRFAELTVNLVEKVTGIEAEPLPEDHFIDSQDEWVRKAAALGIINGVNDGQRFSPNGYLTREQMAVMLVRAIRVLEERQGITVLTAGGLDGYEDAGEVSSWAAEAMGALTASGLLQGTSPTTLSPQDPVTVEQAIVLTYRTYQLFS